MGQFAGGGGGGGAGGGGTVTHTLGGLTSGQLIKGNGSADVATGDLSGDVTTTGTTATTVVATHLSSALPVAQGGTAAATLTAHGVLIGEGTSAVVATAVGTTGQVLTSNGAGADPSFQAINAGTVTHTGGALTANQIVLGNGAADVKAGDLAGDVTTSGSNSTTVVATHLASALPVAQGGTGDTTLTAHGVLVGAGASAVVITGTGTSGQVLTSNGAAADPTFQAVTATGTVLQTGTSTYPGFDVVRTNATTLTINGSVSATNPGIARFGGKTYSFTASATAVISAGQSITGFIYVRASDGAIVVADNGLTLVCTGCTHVGSTTAFPLDGSIPLYTWTTANVAGQWDASGGTDVRALLSEKPVTGGTGVIATNNASGSTSLAIDTAIVPQLGGANSYTGVNTFPGGDLFLGGIDAQSGVSYTIVAADENKLLTFNNAGAVAVTLPQATTAGFTSGAIFHVRNLGAGTATITPTTSQIDSAATLALTTGQGADIYSDGTNYFTQKGASSAGGSGTVNAGTAGQMAYYASSTTAVSGNANATIASGALTLGQSGTLGTLGLTGNTSGVITVQPQAIAGTYNFNLPITAGTSGQALTSQGGAGSAMTWTTPVTTNTGLVDAQSGTSYTIVAADCGKLVTFNNAAATAVTLPQATGSFAAPCILTVENLGAGVVTITPTTSTIAGLTAIALNQNQGATIYSDSTNYQVNEFTPAYLPVAAQVNTLQLGGVATATDPAITAIGSDTNVGIRALTKGTGQITLQQGTDGSVLVIKNAAGTVVDTVTSSTGAIRLGAAGTPGAILDVASKYFVSSGGVNTKYNNISTISNGHPSEYATVDLTAQSAAITATTLYAVPAAANGMYRACFVSKVTTAATTSSTLGGAAGFQLTYTDQDDSVVVTTLSGAFWDSNATNIALNTTQARMGGCTVVNAKASTNIQYIMGYTSSGATAMQYNLHIKLEAL